MSRNRNRDSLEFILDEFQSYTTLSLASALSELRKYGISMTLCHQYIHQLEKEVYHAILGNVGSLIAFRVGVEDAKILAKEFEPELELLDLVNLPNHNIYIRLLVDGVPRRPFSARDDQIIALLNRLLLSSFLTVLGHRFFR